MGDFWLWVAGWFGGLGSLPLGGLLLEVVLLGFLTCAVGGVLCISWI